MKNLGIKLKTLRVNMGLTQSQLAERVGLATSAISAYESDIHYPTYDTLIQLARIFHVSTDYLLGIDNRYELDLSGLSEEEVDALKRLVNAMKKKILTYPEDI